MKCDRRRNAGTVVHDTRIAAGAVTQRHRCVPQLSVETRRPTTDRTGSKTLEHVGHHILKRRLAIGVNQTGAAKLLGTNASTLRNWETGRRKIEIRFYPAILRFLGYNPLPKATPLQNS